MQEKDYINYFLVRNKVHRVTIFLTWLISFFLLLGFELLFDFFKDEDPKSILLFIKNSAEIVIVIMATSLSGWMIGALTVFQLFVTLSAIRYPHFHTFILLNLSIFSNIPLIYGCYKKLWKTVLLFLGLTSLMVFGSCFVWWLMDEPSHLRMEMLMYVVPIGISCTCNYLFANLIPERIRNWFFASSYYSPKVQMLRSRLKNKNQANSIGRHITIIIVTEAVFIILSAYGWSTDFFQNVVANIVGTEEAWRTMFQFMVNMLMTAIPVILVGVAYSNIQVSNPLMLMAIAMEDSYKSALSDQCSLDEISISDLKLEHKNEIGVLYQCLKDSIDNIHSYLDQIKREQQLKSELATAHAASKAKSDFLSNMSHEIRTPINAVLGLDEMILRESSESSIRSYAKDIQSAGNSLLSLVNDILDFSKIEAGKMDIIIEEYDVSLAINDLLNMIAKRAEDKSLALHVQVSPDVPRFLFGDVMRIKQCILNILTNAVKYTEKGSVTFSVSCESKGDDSVVLHFSVADTGIGIKEDDLGKLFSSFQRIEEKRNRTIEGTGLGLNIVQHLLELMHSSLHVKSVYGEGSVFSFNLEQGVKNWEPLGDFDSTYQKSLAADSVYHEKFHAPDARVLVVDDTPLNLTVAKGLLKNFRMQVDTAESGFETLDLVKKHQYDMIFLDHRMPQMDGIETFLAMQTLEGNQNRDVPCIALTANAISGAREQYLQAGFTDYLTKPIDTQKLESMLMSYLPQEKVFAVAESSANSSEAQGVSPLPVLQGIDMDAALKNCGSVDVLRSAFHDFYAAIDDKSRQIEAFAAARDWKNYTVLVHALKSSARLIGATGLSKDAAYLEQCGDSINEPEIESKTPALLALYRSYKDVLQPVAGMGEESKEKEKELLSMDAYRDALSGIKDCMKVADFDSADAIVSMLDEYCVPDAVAEQYAAIKKSIANVDSGAVLALLQ